MKITLKCPSLEELLRLEEAGAAAGKSTLGVGLGLGLGLGLVL